MHCIRQQRRDAHSAVTLKIVSPMELLLGFAANAEKVMQVQDFYKSLKTAQMGDD